MNAIDICRPIDRLFSLIRIVELTIHVAFIQCYWQGGKSLSYAKKTRCLKCRRGRIT